MPEKEKRKWLFVSHDASRTGAPIVLLTLLVWLKKHTDADITILLKDEGPLLNTFKEIGTTYIWKINKPSKALWKRGLSKLIPKYRNVFAERIPNELKRKKFDLVYLNTVVSMDLAPLFKQIYRCPVIAHIHENDFSINSLYASFLSAINKTNIDKFIAVSKSTKENLIRNHSTSEEDVSLIYEFVDIAKIRKPDIPAADVKNKLGLDNYFVVGGSGLTNWRKGTDWFIAIAAYIKREYPQENIKFVWVGSVDSLFQKQLDYELTRYDLETSILFTGSQQNPSNYFQVFDVFALTSREDPFPLVCLESAALNKPVVCFKNSGGMTEFTDSGGGISVPYGNIEAFASVLLSLKNNPLKVQELGTVAKASSEKFDVSVIAPQILNVIDSVCLKSL